MLLQVNGERLTGWLADLARIGATPAGGVTRFALSAEDRQARQWLIDQAAKYGLAHRFDAVGNLFIYCPAWQGRPTILAGSHVDTVPDGGRYDGALGVLSALESLVRLQESNALAEHGLEVVVWTEEEGSRFKGGLVGSRAYIDQLPAAELADEDSEGISLAAALQNWGLDAGAATDVAKQRGKIAGYLELHIEQGGVLEQQRQDIGVVSGIVGIRRYDVRVVGQANHAGTTPMALRRDALVGVAEMVQFVPEKLEQSSFPQAVSTVGKLQVFPGGVNVVPGRVEFTLEVRDLDSHVMDVLATDLLGEFSNIAMRRGLGISWQQTANVIPAPLAPEMRQAVKLAAEELGYGALEMPSGAGHDAQHLARICPTGMIFVPSQGGISHSPHEFTSPEDCIHGANVLLNAILRRDNK